MASRSGDVPLATGAKCAKSRTVVRLALRISRAEGVDLVTSKRRIVFFDLDGTLHRQDMFGSFLRYLLWRQPLNTLLVLLLLPVIGGGLLLKGRAARWPMSLLLWGCTFGCGETRLRALEQQFAGWFREHVTAFPLVQQRLAGYLRAADTDIWLITGSPQSLVQQVYADTSWLPKVNLIASQMSRRYGGRVLTLRCLGQEKVVQLERKIGAPLQLYSGYSDSRQDNPLLAFCRHRWRVTAGGKLQPLK